MRRWAWVGLVLVAGCSRTPLFDLSGATLVTATGGASGAGGGAGTTASGGSAGTSGTGGSGGSGGYLYATGSTCFGFVDRGSRRFDAPVGDERWPELVLSSADAERVSLVYQEGVQLGQVGFDAWGGWPKTSLGQSKLLFAPSGFYFELATAPGDHFALVSQTVANGNPAGMVVSTQATPGQLLAATKQLGGGSDAPLFIARGDSDYLVGFRRHSNGHTAHFGRTPDLGTPVLADSGCATAPVSADAVRAGDHYLVAMSSSLDFGSCPLDGYGEGPPTRIQVVRVSDDNSVKSVVEPPAQGAVSALSMVARSDGAWLVWHVKNQLFAARFDQQGNLVTLPNIFAAVAPGTPFAVDRVADDLALAYVEGDPSKPVIRVALFNADSVNSPHLDFLIHPDPANELPTGPLSLLGAPSGDYLLVSWEADASTGSPVVVTRRLDCVQAN